MKGLSASFGRRTNHGASPGAGMAVSEPRLAIDIDRDMDAFPKGKSTRHADGLRL